MRKVIATILVLLCVVAAVAASPKWESVFVPGRSTAVTERTADSDTVEVSVSDGYIYVSCTRPTNVKVFTILGQLISQETLRAGSHRLHMASRGIYILKAADITRRITI